MRPQRTFHPSSFVTLLFVAAAIMAASAPIAIAAESARAIPPVELKSGVAQLFVDDFLIDSQQGLKRTLRQPKKDNGGNVPILAFDKEYGDYRATLETNGTVIFDTRLKKYVRSRSDFRRTFRAPLRKESASIASPRRMR